MKQFTFTSQLAPIIWKYLESRQNEGYTSVHCGYYMQELDCLSKELSDAPVVTKELIDAWDLLKPYLSNRSKIVRHNAIRAFAKFAYTQDGISYVPDTSKLKNSSTFTPHIFTVEEIRRLLYAADNLPVRNNAPTRHHFKWCRNNFTIRTKDGNHTFTFRNINTNCVHVHKFVTP